MKLARAGLLVLMIGDGHPAAKDFLLSSLHTATEDAAASAHSLDFSKPGEWPTFDGEHLTFDSCQIWGSDIAGEIEKFAAMPKRH
ncbi:MAG TPA: hypothetical protein VGG57_18485 [Stellaceae bacterium]|jgi:hypothetical protein